MVDDDEPRVDPEDEDTERIRRPSRVALPAFLSEEDIGLGDAVKRVTYAAGVRPCRGCERRAAVLNRWVVLSGRSGRRR
ncbi:hypothetical protein OOZ19_03190 [Saccharopolyspora sp. NFXS83]|uniref:hypothetical protein n=1 Tax=Saccharopolyspora sp. NFXS83 TaxID=2993560 RepID=UPI00224B4628|nr:hypothetical protein [Saccharopolyspora sp. NFXS83]MCX2729232.1 hypothetical protein [Saccharopolyspora sp. NFXS83]